MSQSKPTSLPFELLSLIVDHVSQDTSSLASLALTSRDFNTVTTPILYRQFQQRETWYLKHPVYHFTHTILARPDLASCVRHLSLGRLDSIGRRKLRIHDEFLALCQNSIEKTFASWLGSVLCDEQRQAWIDHLDNLLPGTLQSILLCVLPNLETLFLEDDREMIYIWQLFDAASRLVPNKGIEPISCEMPFSKLHSIRRIGDQRTARESLYDCLGYFKLPNLLKLEFSNVHAIVWRDLDHSFNEWESFHRSSSVQYLSLQHSYLSRPILSSVIMACANLKEFHYTVGCEPSRMLYRGAWNILRPLHWHAKTLETLHLSIEPWKYNIYSCFEPFDNDLLELRKLKHLTVSMEFLWPGHGPEWQLPISREPCDILPPSLETLELTSCTPKLFPHIHALDVAKRTGHLPNLRHLKCTFLANSVHPSEFEILSVSGVEVQYELAVDRRCHFCANYGSGDDEDDEEDENGEKVENKRGRDLTEDHSNLFSDDLMLAPKVQVPDSDWI